MKIKHKVIYKYDRSQYNIEPYTFYIIEMYNLYSCSIAYCYITFGLNYDMSYPLKCHNNITVVSEIFNDGC